ncbi:hypothetical protein ABZW11_03950 [Nonomuraea sp. NPDC004580]|uniref:hypothetical protein n=1 Tax=Nonomuraea sp. NPDC004580 TaxID=3154552 RepID=UPI0033B12366
MSQWEIALEPEVESWLDGLSFPLYQRVMRNVDDYLVTGGHRPSNRRQEAV